MAYAESVLDLIGDTPLVRLRRVISDRAEGLVLAKVEYMNPGGSVKDRIALRMVDEAEASGALRAGRHDRRADERQHRGGAGDRRPGPGLPVHLRVPRQGLGRQDRGAPRLRRRGRRVPDRGRSEPPRLVLLGVGPPGPGDPRRLEAGPVREPAEPGLARGHDRAGDLGADRGPGHPLRRRHRHRRHDHRCRPVPEGRERRPGAGDRRRPRGLGVLGRAAAGPTWSRGWARTSGPPRSTRRSPTG